VSEPPVVYRTREDVTPEAELNALAAAYAFVLRDNQQSKEPGGESASENARKRVEKDVPR
jgi:hypothetical protein